MKSNRNFANPLALTVMLLGTSLVQAIPCQGADDVYWNNMRANRIAFFGNSITLHAPNPNYAGWETNWWGMAATVQANDYVHRLSSAISATTGKPLPVDRAYNDSTDGNANNITGIMLESGFASYTNARIQEQLDYKPDIVVLQFGENRFLSTDEQALFKSKLETMMDGLKASSNPNIFITSTILYENSTMDSIKQAVCAEDPAHRIYVDLASFRDDATNRASGEYIPGSPYYGVFDSFILGHPGDKGMQYIADHLYAAMESHSMMVPEPCTTMLMATGLFALLCVVGKTRRTRRG